MPNPLKNPVTNGVLPPKPNPLDESTPLHVNTGTSLAGADETENATTPEASLSFTELEDEEQEEDSTHPSQSTLNGDTFHTTQRTTRLGDGDENQSWQITQTERGTGSTEH